MNDLIRQIALDDVQHDLARTLFLQDHFARGHHHVVRRELKRAVPTTALPTRARNIRTVNLDAFHHVIADIDDAVVFITSWKTSASVTVSASDSERARLLVEEVRSAVTRCAPADRVDVAFVDEHAGTRYCDLETRAWSQVRPYYGPQVSRALDALIDHHPSDEVSQRLLLWHGAPGTGKTTAIRALLESWRDWADGVIVTDPERLLADGKYLRRTVLDHDEDDRWQVIVLEDAETLLHKGSGGRAMSTLLNLCDGLLGQGLRCLFLITTNEPLTAVHPALVRPGRCLSRIEFAALPAEQVTGLLGRPAGSMTLAEVLATAPVTAVAEPVSVGQYL